MFRKCLKHIFLLDISINSNCFEMTDIALEFLFSVIHVSISVYVLDLFIDLYKYIFTYIVLVKVLILI